MSLVSMLQSMKLNLLLKQFNIKTKADEEVYSLKQVKQKLHKGNQNGRNFGNS